MTTWHLTIVVGGRTADLTLRAERRDLDERGAHVFYDETDRPIAWVPSEIVIVIREI